MKKFRKIMAILVAAMMIMASMTITAFADDTYTITIKNSLNGETYSAFKIFNAAEASTMTNDAYVQVPYTDVKEEANANVQYYYGEDKKKADGSDGTDGVIDTWTPIAANARYTTDWTSYKIFEKAYRPVAYTIEADSLWIDAVAAYATNGTKGLILTTIPGQPGVYAVNITEGVFSAKAFAEALRDFYDGLGAADKTDMDNSGISKTNNSTPKDGVQKSELAIDVTSKGLGYYFVDTTLGTLCVLDTTCEDVDVYEKNETPTISKQIFGSAGGARTGWNDYEDNAEIGDTVYFRSLVTDKKGTDALITVYDAMSSGLTLKTSTLALYKEVLENDQEQLANYYLIGDGTTPVNQSGKVYNASNKYYTKMTANIDYTPVTSGLSAATDYQSNPFNTTFTVSFPASALATDQTVYIYYEATLNDGAEMAETPNANSTFLNYSKQKTVPSVVEVYTYEFDLVKYAKTSAKTLLSGATFNLYKGDPWDNDTGAIRGNATPLRFVFDDGTKTYTKIDGLSGANEGDITLTSIVGKINIEGLDLGDYYLVETGAPAGYIPLTAPIKVTIGRLIEPVGNPGEEVATFTGTEVKIYEGARVGAVKTVTYPGSPVTNDGEATVTSTTYTSDGVAVANTPGVELPSTGGMGTTVLYIVGGMLVILAGAYLFFSRKRTA